MNNVEGFWISAFDKNVDEQVRLRLFRGVVGHYLEIRVYAKVRAGDGEASQPTDNGLVLDLDLLPDLRRAINDLAVETGLDNKHALPKPASAAWLDEVLRVKP
jgi:hypothetical protein